MAAIKVKPTQDGTYTVYEGAQPLASGLTRAQADAFLAARAKRTPVAA
jgi:hypothetical protein